jgi:hypothetical protein
MVTPTLVLVNKARQVQRVWTGALGPNQQREVLKSLGASQPIGLHISHDQLVGNGFRSANPR